MEKKHRQIPVPRRSQLQSSAYLYDSCCCIQARQKVQHPVKSNTFVLFTVTGVAVFYIEQQACKQQHLYLGNGKYIEIFNFIASFLLLPCVPCHHCSFSPHIIVTPSSETGPSACCHMPPGYNIHSIYCYIFRI